MRERSRSRGIGVEAVASKSAWSVSGCVEWVYTDLYRVYLSLWILPPFPLDTLHRIEPTYIAALRSCKSFLTTSFLTVLHYGFIFILVSPSLSLSFQISDEIAAFPLLSRFLPISSEMKTLSVQRFFLSFRFLISSSRLSLRKKIRVLERSMEIVRLLERWFDTRKLEGDLFGKKERSVRTRRRRGRGVGDERGMRPVPFRENPVRHVMYHGRQTGRLMRPSRL